jgi:hypothetical protein
MLQRKSLAAMLFATICLLCNGAMADDRNANSKLSDKVLDGLSPETLQTLKVHLPSYFASMQDQLAYQTASPLHQEITVRWSAQSNDPRAPGAEFTPVKRWQHMPKSASLSQLKPGDQPMVVIAATSGGEVRALAVCADTRSTTGEINIQLPQDAKVDKLIFLHLVSSTELELIGEANLLPPTALAGGKTRNSAVAHKAE